MSISSKQKIINFMWWKQKELEKLLPGKEVNYMNEEVEKAIFNFDDEISDKVWEKLTNQDNDTSDDFGCCPFCIYATSILTDYQDYGERLCNRCQYGKINGVCFGGKDNTYYIIIKLLECQYHCFGICENIGPETIKKYLEANK